MLFQLRFVRPPNGGGLELHGIVSPLAPVIYRSVPRVVPAVEELGVYAGNYTSAELDVTYTVLVEHEKLAIRRRKHGVTALEPAFADAFNGVADVRFTRDTTGGVDGMLVTTGRVRNLRFTRGGPAT